MSLVGVFPAKVPFVELVKVKVMSTSPWIVDGLSIVKPETFSFTIIILHLPSNNAMVESTESVFLQENSVKQITAIGKITCFIKVVYTKRQFLKDAMLYMLMHNKVIVFTFYT